MFSGREKRSESRLVCGGGLFSLTFSRSFFLVNNLLISNPTLEFFKLVEAEDPAYIRYKDYYVEWSEVDEHLNKVALRDGNASAIAYSLLVERDRAEKGKANSPTLKDPLDQFQARQSIPKTKEPINPCRKEI